MKFLSLLFLLASSAAFAGNGSGNVSALVGHGGFNGNPDTIFTPMGDRTYFTLYAGGQVTVADDVYPFVKNGALYQVPAICNAHACTTRCEAFTISGSVVNMAWQLMSATATFAITGATPASLSGAKYQSSASATYPMWMAASAAYMPDVIHSNYEFTASTWAGFQAAVGTQRVLLRAECYEY